MNKNRVKNFLVKGWLTYMKDGDECSQYINLIKSGVSAFEVTTALESKYAEEYGESAELIVTLKER